MSVAYFSVLFQFFCKKSNLNPFFLCLNATELKVLALDDSDFCPSLFQKLPYSLFISLLYMESRLRSEHLYSKTATIGTFFKNYDDNFTDKCALLSAWNFQVSLYHVMLKKVPKVADLRPLCSDLGRDSVVFFKSRRSVSLAHLSAA